MKYFLKLFYQDIYDISFPNISNKNYDFNGHKKDKNAITEPYKKRSKIKNPSVPRLNHTHLSPTMPKFKSILTIRMVLLGQLFCDKIFVKINLGMQIV